MPTHIKQTEYAEPNRTVLSVEGDMFLDDAIFLSKIARERVIESSGQVIVELSDLGFLDSDAAAVLRELETNERISFQGMETFVQAAIDSVERRAGMDETDNS